MSAVARKILGLSDKPATASTRLTYGVMASATTVYIDGSSVAVTVPKLASAGTLATNDYVALLQVGPDVLIIGEVA